VGEEKEQQDLALKFKDLTRRQNASALFFGVDQDHFQFYLDMGLTVLKIGEEARVSLKTFDLESQASADLRNTHQKFKEREEFAFEVLSGAATAPHWKEFKAVSEGWLSKHRTREKGFLTGFLKEEYLKWFPIAVVRKENKMIAFAGLWQAESKEEAAIDLLRSSAEAPAFTEDYLKLELLLWAKEKGYEYFNLGTAPILDIEESPLAPFKGQLAQIFSPYGTQAQLQDIRKEKERFNPLWSPKYLAASANLPLSLAFNNIRDLVAMSPRGGSRK
jgi:phosphatidylglycerol lysyltransferase